MWINPGLLLDYVPTKKANKKESMSKFNPLYDRVLVKRVEEKCRTCNSGIGLLQDSVTVLENAIAYIVRGKEVCQKKQL